MTHNLPLRCIADTRTPQVAEIYCRSDKTSRIDLSSIPGNPLHYSTFCQIHEDVLEWLLDVEDKLRAMGPLEDDRDRLKEQFNSYNAFMNEVKQQDQAVGEVSFLTIETCSNY